MSRIVRTAMIGCGGMARAGTCRPCSSRPTPRKSLSSVSLHRSSTPKLPKFSLPPDSDAVLPNQPDLDRLLREHGDRLDAAFIITPHAFHHDQTVGRAWKRGWTCSWKSRW